MISLLRKIISLISCSTRSSIHLILHLIDHVSRSEDAGHLARRYSRGVKEIPYKDRIKIARLISAIVDGTAVVDFMHGAGSPQAQRVMVFREGNLDREARLEKASLGIPLRSDRTV
jgi:4-hydroxybutyryl-CoA dehydratase/vinylacetyl-CoA-Delta-isomerase